MDIQSDKATLFDSKIESLEAFDKLFRFYYPRLFSYVSTILEESVAEDIVQDVFLYIWENRNKIYIGEGFHSYLFQSGYTRAMDYLRKQQVASDYSSNLQTGIYELYESLSKSDGEILEQLYSKDFYESLYKLLDLVPEQRREVFLLAYVQGLRAKEIALKLNISQRTVESHIYLTLKFLKEKLLKPDFFILLTFFTFY